MYPPLALDELAIVGRLHLAWSGGRFPDDVRLTMLIKGAIVLLDAVLAVLLFLVVQPVAGSRVASWAALGYWINPAVLMIATLGDIDVFFAIPAVGAVVAASYGRSWLAGALFAAGVLTKPQGIFVAPVVWLALANAGSVSTWRARVGAAGAASAGVAALLVAPIFAAGTAEDMVRSVAVLAGHDMLSRPPSTWWIVGYLLAATTAAHHGIRAALTASPHHHSPGDGPWNPAARLRQ